MTRLEQYLSFVVLDKRTKPARRPVRVTRRGPARNPRYLAYIRTLPCCVCGAFRVEASHTGSDGGMRQKASDFSAVPLCHRCHRTGKRAYHVIGKRAFEALHAISFDAIAARLMAEWGGK
jgi:hypothetical protein